MMTQKKKSVQQKDAEKWAAIRTNSTKNAALAIRGIFKDEDISLGSLKDELVKQQEQIRNGNSEPLENMLISQAQTLEALFYMASERVPHCETKEQMHAYAELSIKANNACRKTISTLHHLKNPSRAIFISEQNNSLAQQVNHHLTISKSENELLTEIPYETVDRKRTIAPIPVNQKMEAVEISRRQNSSRQAKK